MVNRLFLMFKLSRTAKCSFWALLSQSAPVMSMMSLGVINMPPLIFISQVLFFKIPKEKIQVRQPKGGTCTPHVHAFFCFFIDFKEKKNLVIP